MAARRGIAQRHHLGMRAADLLGVPLAEHHAIRVHQHAADAWIGVGLRSGLVREVQGLGHEIHNFICICHFLLNQIYLEINLKTIELDDPLIRLFRPFVVQWVANKNWTNRIF